MYIRTQRALAVGVSVDKLEILDGVSLSDFDTKETSDIIKKLNTIVK